MSGWKRSGGYPKKEVNEYTDTEGEWTGVYDLT